MSNLSNKLELLFRQYLIRKESERNIPFNSSSSNSDWLNKKDTYNGVIYFYELSDVNRCPVSFYTIGAFDAFLRKYNIYLPLHQEDIIRQLEKAYITCKTGTHELLIRGTRPLLLDAVGDSTAKPVDVNTVGSVIMNNPVPVGLGSLPGSNNMLLPAYNGYPGEWY